MCPCADLCSAPLQIPPLCLKMETFSEKNLAETIQKDLKEGLKQCAGAFFFYLLVAHF